MKIINIIFIIFISLLHLSCGRANNIGDYALMVATGGILPLPCELGITKCPKNNNNIPTINNEANKTVKKSKNKPPRLEFYKSKLDLNVGDEKNLLIKIVDPDDDNITDVYYFIEDPSLAVLELSKDPYELKIIAKKEGNTNIRVLAKDYYLNEGQTELLPLSIIDESNAYKAQVKFTDLLVEMDVSSTYSITYIYAGFNQGYEVAYKTTRNLVEAQVIKSTQTIIIKSKEKAGTDQIAFAFLDSKNQPYTIKVSVLVKGKKNTQGDGGTPIPPTTTPPTTTPPTNVKDLPRETENLVFNDRDACSSSWDQISHSYGQSSIKTVSSKNSIAIQSLTVGATMTLYYRELTQSAPADRPYGIDLAPPPNGLPLGPNTRDSEKERLFILQASPLFALSNRPNKNIQGYNRFYLKIFEECYRGKFPPTESESDSAAVRLEIKLVVN